MDGLEKYKKHKYVKDIRGKGLFLAIEFGNEAKAGYWLNFITSFGWPFALKLLENGIVTRPS